MFLQQWVSIRVALDLALESKLTVKVAFEEDSRMPNIYQGSFAEGQEVLVSSSSHYLLQSFGGEGSFGKVATCLNMDTKQKVAVKILNKTDYNRVAAEEEVNIIPIRT